MFQDEKSKTITYMFMLFVLYLDICAIGIQQDTYGSAENRITFVDDK